MPAPTLDFTSSYSDVFPPMFPSQGYGAPIITAETKLENHQRDPALLWLHETRKRIQKQPSRHAEINTMDEVSMASLIA